MNSRRLSRRLLSVVLLAASPFTASANWKWKCENKAEYWYWSGYYLKNNVWNTDGVTQWEQCVGHNSSNQLRVFDWKILTDSSKAGQNAIKSYPAMVYGWRKGGHWSIGAKLGWNKNIWTAWKFAIKPSEISGNQWGRFNCAYDIYFHTIPDPVGNTPVTHELMIWPYKTSGFNFGTAVATKQISGHTWKIYRREATYSSNSWWYIAYVRTANTTNLGTINIKHFTDDMRNRGWISKDHYLSGIQTGCEIVKGTGRCETQEHWVNVDW